MLVAFGVEGEAFHLIAYHKMTDSTLNRTPSFHTALAKLQNKKSEGYFYWRVCRAYTLLLTKCGYKLLAFQIKQKCLIGLNL